MCLSIMAFVYAAFAFRVWPTEPFKAPNGARAASTETFWEQLTSPAYRACVTWYSMLLIGTQFSVASVNDQMRMKADEAWADFLITAFQVAMGICGFGAPVTGFVIDSAGFATVAAAITLGFAGCYLCLLSPRVELQFVAFGLHAVSRVSCFAFFFAYISGTFGFRYYGKLAGLGLLLSALFSLGLYPLLRMSFALGSFAYANLVLLSLAAAALLFPLRLSREERAGAPAEPAPAPEPAPAQDTKPEPPELPRVQLDAPGAPPANKCPPEAVCAV